jgi:hypothetical protein
LAEEDAAALANDDSVSIHDDMTPAMLISSGLDIESQQYVTPILCDSDLGLIMSLAGYDSRPIAMS